jgi:hypothetical protein
LHGYLRGWHGDEKNEKMVEKLAQSTFAARRSRAVWRNSASVS